MKKDLQEIIGQLQLLHHAGIIQYAPQKDKPQLYFIQNRVLTENLYINPVNYKIRKERYSYRIDTQLHFVRMEGECRSRYIANYFGDEDAGPCGICDNCLRIKQQKLEKGEFESILQRIMTSIGSKEFDQAGLLKEFKGIEMEKAWKVIKELQLEKKLLVDDNGILRLTN